MVTKNSKLSLFYDASLPLQEIYRRSKAVVPADSGHDFSHIERVALKCETIFCEEIVQREKREASPAEKESCWVAGLLHDCVPIAKDSPLRKESSRLASEKAREWLNELRWSASSIDEIADAILDHSFSAGREPRSLLGQCLQDADRLEALGAIGLYRVIATGVSMGAVLFHPDDPFAGESLKPMRELDDKKYSVDHFYTKLLKLPSTFRTRSAQAEAVQRAAYLKAFLDQLKSELA